MSGETISREQATEQIRQLAVRDGIVGSFKVYHQGKLVVNPTDLPDHVNMADVRVSAALDNA